LQKPVRQNIRTLYPPSLYVVESILADLMRERGHQPDLVAGHSLGISPSTSLGFDWAAGLRLVKRRAELMDSAAGGMMAALLGLTANNWNSKSNKPRCGAG